MKRECRETLERTYLFLDREMLDPQERAAIRVHLERCKPCHERYGLEDEVKRLVARLRGWQRCPDTLRVRIETLLHD
jgi:mycothiol system anti-sigma-R factor